MTHQKINNYLIFGTPRTGSTLLINIYYIYLLNKYGTVSKLDEYFSPYHFFNYRTAYTHNNQTVAIKYSTEFNNGNYYLYPTESKNNQLIIDKIYHPVKTSDIALETQRRWNLLIKLKDTTIHSLKIFPEINDNIFDWLIENYQPILIERTNKLEQYLSYEIATHTKSFIIRSEKYRKIPNDYSIRAKKTNFDLFFNRIERYGKLKEKIKNPIIINYENDLKSLDNKFSILEKFGITDWQKYSAKRTDFSLPVINTPYPKHTKFVNYGDIITWYQNSDKY